MEIADDILIGSQEQHRQVVRCFVQSMEIQHVLDVLEVYEAIDLAVRVAGDITQGGDLRRYFIQALNRDDGEELLDSPEIRHRLKHRKISDVLGGEGLLQ